MAMPIQDEQSDPFNELEAGPPQTAEKQKKPKRKSRKSSSSQVVYDRRACRYTGCQEKNSGPRYKLFCKYHYKIMNPEPPETTKTTKTTVTEPMAPESKPDAAQKEQPMAKQTVPVGPDGIQMDKLSAMHEPFHVRLVRLRGIGPEEPVQLPTDGHGWTLTQVRNLEAWTREQLGGGDFASKVVDERGQTYSWNWHNTGEERKTAAQAGGGAAQANLPATTTNPVPPAPLNSTSATPANVVPIGNGLGVTTLSNGMSIVVPMQNTNDTAGPPVNGPLNARAAAQVWGGNADAAQQFLAMTQRLERAEAENQRLKEKSDHEREMNELRNAISQMAKQSATPDAGMKSEIEELKRQLLAKDADARHREEMAELRRTTEKQIESLTVLVKESAAHKEDPFMRAFVEAQKDQSRSQAEAAKAQADAAKEVARLQSEAQREAARESNKTMETILAKTDQATLITPFLQAFTGISQLTQGMTSTMLDVIKEVAEIKGEKDGSWVERLFGPLAEKLPEVGQTLAEGYALSQQAKLRGAPSAVAAQAGQKRKPRELTEAKPAELQAKPDDEATPGNGESASHVKVDPIELALRGYESNIPGEKEQYDAAQWGPILPQIVSMRRAVLKSNATPADVGRALVGVVVHAHQYEIADKVPALRFLNGGAEEFATFVGIAIGSLPEKQDYNAFMTFKRQTLDMFVKAFRSATEEYQKSRGEDGDGVEDDDSGSVEDQSVDESSETQELPGAAS